MNSQHPSSPHLIFARAFQVVLYAVCGLSLLSTAFWLLVAIASVDVVPGFGGAQRGSVVVTLLLATITTSWAAITGGLATALDLGILAAQRTEPLTLGGPPPVHHPPYVGVDAAPTW